MSGGLFIQNRAIGRQIVNFGGVIINGFDEEGAGFTSANLTDATAPTRGSGGFWCAGSEPSEQMILTWRILRGSPGFRRMNRIVADPGDGRFISVRPDDFPLGRLDYDFWSCAYAVSSDARGPNFNPADKFATYTVYAGGYQDRNVNII